MPESTVVHDPQVLRAIAHPLRNRILGELNAQGSMRAADVARELDIAPNLASFHLRQLAKYGLVEEDPAAARDKRDRVWKVAHEEGLRINLEELREQPGGAAAAGVFQRNAASWGRYVVDQSFVADPEHRHRSVMDGTLRLTQDEAKALSAELDEVVARWAKQGRGSDPAERTTYLYYGMLLPHPAQPEQDA